jgi:hypothetical protein
MNTSILALLAALILSSSVSAFAPTAFTRGIEGRSQLFAAEPPKEEEGLDLNLEEMFDMYVFITPTPEPKHTGNPFVCDTYVYLSLTSSYCRFDAADKEESFDDALKKVKKAE